MKRALVALAACGAQATPHTATWAVAGDLAGVRAADDTQGGRATCTAAIDDDGAPTLTLFFATGTGAGLHLTLAGFDRAGSYGLGAGARGLAVVYDLADLLACSQGSSRCYGAASGCTVTVDDWDLGEVLPGGRAGVAHGSLACTALENDRHGRVAVSAARFSCRATDWR